MSTPNIPLTLNCDALPISASVNDILIKYTSALAEIQRLLAEVERLRDELAAARQRETIAIASWDEERNRALREGKRVVEWRDRAERAEADLYQVASERTDGILRESDLQCRLNMERARLKKIETALKDAISTYFGDDKLVTAERIEAWQAALKEDAK